MNVNPWAPERIFRRLFGLGGQSTRISEGSPAGTGHNRSRRDFLKRVFLLAAAPLVTPISLSFAELHDFWSSERSLSLYNTHTGESLRRPYWREGVYLRDAMAEINHIFRDHRTGEIKPIEPQLVDLLCAIHRKLGTWEPFHIISGYRCPSTNALLRKKNPGVAKKSLHMQGKAADIRLPGCGLSLLRRVAVDMRGGGVGYYPKSRFVHVDVGRVRYW
jgi:uncharacterized protein YcbK (DUF882 family)